MSAPSTLDISKHLSKIDQTSPVTSKGRVKEAVGLLVRAIVPEARVGELCLIHNSRSPVVVKAEVVGFQGGDVLLMPLGALADIGPESEVVPTGRSLTIRVGEGLLGRVMNGLGEPMDTAEKGPLHCFEEYPVYGRPPDPLQRNRITKPISLGVQSNRFAAHVWGRPANWCVRGCRSWQEHVTRDDCAQYRG